MKATQPSDMQLADIASADLNEPIAMLNLLKFKESATYDPGTPEAEEKLSGLEAYLRYGAGVYKVLESVGAKPLFNGPVSRYVIGAGENWDAIAVVWYPSRKAFLEMTSSEDYQSIHYHRVAGLAHQVLIETTPGDV